MLLPVGMNAARSTDGRSKDAGYKSSVGLEALAIFGLATFIIRIAVDIAQRVRNGRSVERRESLLGGLTHSVLSMLGAAARLYDHPTGTH